MPQEKTEAVVLRGVDFSETSRIVTLLTPDRGKIACMAKGARRKNSALGPVLDTLNRVELVYYWKDGRAVQTLAEAQLLDSFRAVKTDLERNALVAFPLEIVYRVAHENDPSDELYAALVYGLQQLNKWTGDPWWHVSWQSWQLLRAAGFEPEVGCSIHTGAAITGTPLFSMEGGVTQTATANTRRLTESQWQGLKILSKFESCPLAMPEEATTRALFYLLADYVRHQLECDFRSVRVIRELLN